MKKFDPTPFKGKGPEARIQDAIMKKLTERGWFCKKTHGNMYQSGLPDIFATHKWFGHRWIEVKLPKMKGSKFTPAQLKVFPEMCKHGSGVWILTSDSDKELEKLKQPFNWWKYLDVLKK